MFIFGFLRVQLFLGLHSSLDGKLVNRKLLLQDLIITTLYHVIIFFNSSACGRLITRVSFGLAITTAQFRNVGYSVVN